MRRIIVGKQHDVEEQRLSSTDTQQNPIKAIFSKMPIQCGLFKVLSGLGSGQIPHNFA